MSACSVTWVQVAGLEARRLLAASFLHFSPNSNTASGAGEVCSEPGSSPVSLWVLRVRGDPQVDLCLTVLSQL